MGCFCRNLIPTLDVEFTAALDLKLQVALGNPLIESISAHLSARWLPAPAWNPDPAWLEIQWPDIQIPAASLSVLVNLAFALETCRITFGLDLTIPAHVDRLARIVATLNARLSLLMELDLDQRPWLSLLHLNAQLDTVHEAIRLGLFTAPSASVHAEAHLSLALWRPTLLKVKLLAPLVSLGQMLKLDWTQSNATDLLAGTMRLLARIQLPQLLDAALVLRLVARLDAIARLKLSLGGDPSPHSFIRIRAAMERRLQLALSLLPVSIRLEAGVLIGMPALEPNPGHILNAGTIRLARLITPQILARLRWQVPAFEELALLTVGLPVAHLVGAMAKLDIDPVRSTPCITCDAAQVMRAVTALPGSGTGAVPAR